jgi:hypothetical protein
MTGYGSSADWVYRVDRRTSIGVSYGFSHFDFTKIFGDTDVHTLGFHASRKFGRDWDLSGSLTGSNQSTVGVRNVSLDPVLAAILGRSSGAEVFESNNLLYGYSASVARTIRRSRLSLTAQRAITPGNGYFLTSINQAAGVIFNHTINRDISVDAGFGYNKMTSLGFASGSFDGWGGNGGVVYKVSESIGFNVRYDWRTLSLSQTGFSRNGHRFSCGINYFPQRGIAGMF